MSDYYCVNNNSTHNPGLHHEVHTEEHADELGIRSRTSLGLCSDGVDAVSKARVYYSDADGCAICCPEAHTG